MRQTFTIYGRLAGTNDYVNAAHTPWKRTKLKQEQEAIVMEAAAGLKPMQPPVKVTVDYFEGKAKPRQRMRDLDNVFGGNKFILDALVSMGIIPNDDTKNVVRLSCHGFRATECPRIEVTLESED